MGRSRTRQRMKEREKQRRRNRQITILVVVAALAITVVVLAVIAGRPATIDISEDIATRYEGIPQGFTEEGFPRVGDENAPVRLVEYSSFDCPSCGRFNEDVAKNLISFLEAGQLQFIYVPLFGTGGIQNGEGAARAAICAGEQGSFWEYHDLLFEWQRNFSGSAYTQNRILGGVNALGLDTGEFRSCINSSETNEVLEVAAESFRQVDGATGTPTVQINGELVTPSLAAVTQAIEQGIALAPPPVEDEESTEEAAEDEEATEEAAEDEEATEEAAEDEEATEEAAEDEEAAEEAAEDEEATEEAAEDEESTEEAAEDEEATEEATEEE